MNELENVLSELLLLPSPVYVNAYYWGDRRKWVIDILLTPMVCTMILTDNKIKRLDFSYKTNNL